MQTLLFAPEIDKCFEKTVVHSRIGLQSDAIPFDEKTNFFEIIEERKNILQNLRCILVDEAHFLKKEQVAQLTAVTTQLHLAVLCYGLRSDFLGETFEGSKYLLAWAEELVEIKTICTCGRKATMNMRIDKEGRPITEGAQIQIRNDVDYISQCMKCFRAKVGSLSPTEVYS